MEKGLNINYLKTPKNIGPGDARQYALDNIPNLKYIFFLDDDDLLGDQNVIKAFTEKILQDPNFFYICGGHIDIFDNKVTNINVSSNNCMMQGILLNKEKLDKYNIRFNPFLSWREEDTLFSTMLSIYKYLYDEPIYHLSDDIFSYKRVHYFNVSTLTRDQNLLLPICNYIICKSIETQEYLNYDLHLTLEFKEDFILNLENIYTLSNMFLLELKKINTIFNSHLCPNVVKSAWEYLIQLINSNRGLLRELKREESCFPFLFDCYPEQICQWDHFNSIYKTEFEKIFN